MKPTPSSHLRGHEGTFQDIAACAMEEWRDITRLLFTQCFLTRSQKSHTASFIDGVQTIRCWCLNEKGNQEGKDMTTPRYDGGESLF